jgi:NAD(P)H-hydrate repair Nnr-like enzyme with NAD(P)H-hydrate epimerase domain
MTTCRQPFIYYYIYCMNILSANQIREWDSFTIQHEPISSVDLMERAAEKVVEYILNKMYSFSTFTIFCG